MSGKLWLLGPAVAGAVFISKNEKSKTALTQEKAAAKDGDCAEASKPEKIIEASKLLNSFVQGIIEEEDKLVSEKQAWLQTESLPNNIRLQ